MRRGWLGIAIVISGLNDTAPIPFGRRKRLWRPPRSHVKRIFFRTGSCGCRNAPFDR